MSLNIDEWLEKGAHELREVAERPRREAEIILGHVLKKDRLYLITHLDEVCEAEDYMALVDRRAENEPIEYIIGTVSFYSQEFHVAKGALIARPETELLIDEVLERVAKDSSESIVEVGVGSGVISIVLAQHLKKANFIASDISEDALRVAKINIDAKQMSERIKLVHTDLLEGIDTKIDILVSNPPYIAAEVVLESHLDHEPQNALFGGSVGDEILKRLIDEAYERKVRILACEMGYDQQNKIEEYCKGREFISLEFYKDYAGHDRGFILTLSKEN